jgi:hypothetical protein
MNTNCTCAVPGCQRPAALLPDGSHGFCEQHADLAPDPLRQRFLTLVRRLRAIRAMWDDEGRYQAIVESGRYLKLAHATCCAEEALDAAAQRLTLAIIAAQSIAGSTPAPQMRRSA